MSIIQNKINQELASFVSKSDSIHAAAVMTRDGIPIASRLDKSVNEERLSAISASLLSLADRAAKDLSRGDLEQLMIDCSEGFVLMLKVGENAVLAIVSERNSRLGMLLVEAKKSARILEKMV